MPTYVFERGGRRVERFATIAEADQLFSEMYGRGYHQVYSAQKPICVPTYQEALEETDQMLAEGDRGEGPLVGKVKAERSYFT